MPTARGLPQPLGGNEGHYHGLRLIARWRGGSPRDTWPNFFASRKWFARSRGELSSVCGFVCFPNSLRTLAASGQHFVATSHPGFAEFVCPHRGPRTATGRNGSRPVQSLHPWFHGVRSSIAVCCLATRLVQSSFRKDTQMTPPLNPSLLPARYGWLRHTPPAAKFKHYPLQTCPFHITRSDQAVTPPWHSRTAQP